MLNTYIASGRALESAIVAMRAAFVKGPIVVTVAAPKEVRSLKLNARYWLLLTLIADSVQRPDPENPGRKRLYPKEAWHRALKEEYLTPVELPLPNGETWLKYPSTSEMSQQEFGDYMTQCEVWANEHGVIMPEYEG